MKDRRKFKRFQLSLPARMETNDSSIKQIFKFKTKDISSAGVFVDANEKFSEGTRFKMNLIVPSEKIKKLTGNLGLIECEGIVVRCTDHGMAICFDGDCQLGGLKNF